MEGVYAPLQLFPTEPMLAVQGEFAIPPALHGQDVAYYFTE
jgi:hypothetical protein